MRFSRFKIAALSLTIFWWLLPISVNAEEASSTSCRLQYAKFGHHRSVEELRAEYKKYVPVTAEENKRFIQFVQKDPSGHIFFDMENAVLKELNDRVIRDKDLVTALTNRYKSLLFLYVKGNALLRERLVHQYSDFKSVRIAFSTEGENAKFLEEQLQYAYFMATRQFVHELDAAGLQINSRGLSSRPSTWHLAGVASTADEANVATRFARAVKPDDHGEISPQSFTLLEPKIRDILKVNEQRRNFLVQNFHHYENFFVPHPNRPGDYLPSPALIKTVKDIKPADASLRGYLRAAKEEFKRVWKMDLTNKQIIALRDYVNFADRISASLLIEERVILDLEKASAGVVSVDFAGQGVRNLFQTMAAISEKNIFASGDDLAKISVKQAREAERKATVELDRKKLTIADAIGNIRNEAKAQMGFSGDDGIFLPAKEFTREEKWRFVQAASASGEGSSYRITFQPQNYRDTNRAISGRDRSGLVVSAEGFEKTLRKYLMGKIPPPDQEKFLIAVDFYPNENSAHQVELLVQGMDRSQLEIFSSLAKEIAKKEGIDLIGVRSR